MERRVCRDGIEVIEWYQHATCDNGSQGEEPFHKPQKAKEGYCVKANLIEKILFIGEVKRRDPAAERGGNGRRVFV